MSYHLRAEDVSKTFGRGDDIPVEALDAVSLSLTAGEFVVLIGANGSGKTTLLRILAGDLFPDSGRLLHGDDGSQSDWTRVDRRERALYVARVQQDPELGTVPELTVRENMLLAALRSGVPAPIPTRRSADRDAYFRSRLAEVGLEDKLSSPVWSLSGGQRQLLALELALLREPQFLLLDEHTASLDQANARACMEATVVLAREKEVGVLLVTHNLSDAAKYGDRLVVLREGRIVAELGSAQREQTTVPELFTLCGYT